MTAWRAYAGAGILSALATAAPVSAAVIQLDLNHVSIQAADGAGANGFAGSTHTGSLVLKMGQDTRLADLLIDGISQDLGGAQLVGMDGVIHLLGGTVTGGGMRLVVLDTLGEEQAYSFDLVAGGGAFHPSGAPYMLVGDTEEGLFSDSRIGPVDVSFWEARQPVAGTLLLDDYRPDASGFFDAAHVEVLAVAVPEPGMALVAAPIVLGLLRRRGRTN